jgi:hypothetical protein
MNAINVFTLNDTRYGSLELSFEMLNRQTFVNRFHNSVLHNQKYNLYVSMQLLFYT